MAQRQLISLSQAEPGSARNLSEIKAQLVRVMRTSDPREPSIHDRAQALHAKIELMEAECALAEIEAELNR